MKTKLLLFSCLLSILTITGSAQTAEFIFLNNNIGTDAASLDVEVRTMPGDVFYSKYTGVNYHAASTIITVPANTILNINYLKSGTSTVYYSRTNVIFDANEFDIDYLSGGSGAISFTEFTAHKTSSSASKVKFCFRHSTSGLGEIDLAIRQTGLVLADDYVYGDQTFGGVTEFPAQDITLDIKDFISGTNMFSYLLPGASLGNQFIFLFSSGSASVVDMYMLKMDGSVTKLATTSVDVKEAFADNAYKIYPNPLKTSAKVSFEKPVSGVLTIHNLVGSTIKSIVVNEANEIEIDRDNMASGVYILSIQQEGLTTKLGKIIVAD